MNDSASPHANYGNEVHILNTEKRVLVILHSRHESEDEHNKYEKLQTWSST